MANELKISLVLDWPSRRRPLPGTIRTTVLMAAISYGPGMLIDSTPLQVVGSMLFPLMIAPVIVAQGRKALGVEEARMKLIDKGTRA
ncbi:hypothetical protein [Limimaricola cinnabarinus]|uniref:Uncharacterized protein n=1 Tax=Limimaricola cinnabarinus TaxID=1125964 RepID=A0A2G1MH62_9RHOB|nr:hypothetical protein [Limimaricola cinnabarinus]PHP28027.1 hypothetical protein CJ301_08565 [Limimaricola cinnabarinus]